ncbi:MAG: hypothetical protein ABI767_10635 [Rhodanobacter sp.]
MFSTLFHRLQKRCVCGATMQLARQSLRVTPEHLIHYLPALGNVLYMPLRSDAKPVVEMPRGFLVEAMSLAPLLRARWLVIASQITVDGPREWIDCISADHQACARMYLLPDTDYLAWDALLGCGDRVAESPAFASAPAAASAQMLHFHARRMAGLQMLGAELATMSSTLSKDLAGRIARYEALPLQLPASG